ncbi:MAG TPA: hypothetical protein ENN39_11825 [Desulfonatronum sp.]|nr:hypothetical protein [Desulfonatronum sp.]
MKIVQFILMACMIVVQGGCSWLKNNDHSPLAYKPSTDLISTHYSVADELQTAMCLPELREYPLLMSTFVALEDLDQSSPLGRLIPQQIGSRFAQHGIQVVDVRLRTKTLLIRNHQGEFALSRELQNINQGVNAYAVLTGTYSVVYGKVYVNAMILRAADGAVLAALDYTLPVDRRALLPDAAPDKSFDASTPLTPAQLPDPHQGLIDPSVFTRL